jgi:hypothetical protein
MEQLAVKTQPVNFHGFITLQSVIRLKSRSILPRGKRPWHSPNTTLGGSDSRSARYGKENYFCFCRYLKQDSPIVQPAVSSYPSSLLRNWCRESVGGEGRFGRKTDRSQPPHVCVQNYLNYLAWRHTHISLLCFETREARWSLRFSRSIVSGKPTLQIDLPLSPKLKVQKSGSLLHVIIIYTKLANSILNGVGYHVSQWA